MPGVGGAGGEVQEGGVRGGGGEVVPAEGVGEGEGGGGGVAVGVLVRVVIGGGERDLDGAGGVHDVLPVRGGVGLRYEGGCRGLGY